MKLQIHVNNILCGQVTKNWIKSVQMVQQQHSHVL